MHFVAIDQSERSEPCRICAATARRVFTQQVLNRPVDYYECARCGYLQTQSPNWLDQAYSRAINDVDTGIMVRNQLNVGRVVMTLLAFDQLQGRVVDHAGGYGILVRMLRDVGVNAFWRDKYCENVLARGFEDDGERIDLLTAFEVFEHLVDPLAELRLMLDEAAVVLLSTELIHSLATPSPDWWYLGPEHGQHIGFFRAATLRLMADRLGCHHASDGRSVHLFSRKPVPAAWRPLVRVQRLWPLAAHLCLRSKTNGDFEALRRQFH